MFLEKEAIDYFRRNDFLLPVFSGSQGDIPSRIIANNMEFEQYNNYYPGDNIKDIDWKVYGRTDKLFVKKYGSDLSSRVRLIVDNSQSMAYFNKLDLALKTVAIFYYQLQNFHSKVSLSSLNHHHQERGAMSLPRLESTLSEIQTSGILDVEALNVETKSISFFLSDLWTRDENIEDLISKKIHVIHIMHPTERELDISGNVEFIDLESNRKLEVIPSTIRDEYKKRMHKRLEVLASRFRQAGLSYGIIDGSDEYYIQLKQYLNHSLHFKNKRTI